MSNQSALLRSFRIDAVRSREDGVCSFNLATGVFSKLLSLGLKPPLTTCQAVINNKTCACDNPFMSVVPCPSLSQCVLLHESNKPAYRALLMGWPQHSALPVMYLTHNLLELEALLYFIFSWGTKGASPFFGGKADSQLMLRCDEFEAAKGQSTQLAGCQQRPGLSGEGKLSKSRSWQYCGTCSRINSSSCSRDRHPALDHSSRTIRSALTFKVTCGLKTSSTVLWRVE